MIAARLPIHIAPESTIPVLAISLVMRFEVWLVNLDPTVGSDIKKTRPAVIVSPDELNAHLHTVIVLPLTTGRTYAFRIPTQVQGK